MTCLLVLLGMLLAAPGLAARGADTDGAGLQRYIVEFHDPPLVRYAGRQTRAGSVLQSVGGPVSKSAGGSRLDMAAAVNRDYLERLEGRHKDFLQEAEMLLGRQASAVYRYRVATNGMAVDLTPAEASALARSPQLKSIHRDRRRPG